VAIPPDEYDMILTDINEKGLKEVTILPTFRILILYILAWRPGRNRKLESSRVPIGGFSG
jgi:hypothetical protein